MSNDFVFKTIRNDKLRITSYRRTFDIVHPFKDSNSKFDKVLSCTLEFLNKNLK